MPEVDSSTDESFDLKRYRQAADVAYRYAKDRIEKEDSPAPSKEEDAFGKEGKKGTTS
jgi:hypothetical protein